MSKELTKKSTEQLKKELKSATAIVWVLFGLLLAASIIVGWKYTVSKHFNLIWFVSLVAPALFLIDNYLKMRKIRAEVKTRERNE